VSRGHRGAGGCGSDGRGDSLVAAPGLATPRGFGFPDPVVSAVWWLRYIPHGTYSART